jgi:hypothetical protein
MPVQILSTLKELIKMLKYVSFRQRRVLLDALLWSRIIFMRLRFREGKMTWFRLRLLSVGIIQSEIKNTTTTNIYNNYVTPALTPVIKYDSGPGPVSGGATLMKLVFIHCPIFCFFSSKLRKQNFQGKI